MDPQFKTSFIPKKPIVVSTAGFRAPSTVNLFTLLATIVFIVAVVLSGSVFFYKGLLTKQIADNKATLERARGAFEPRLIEQIIRLDTRIEISKQLMASHLALTPFFDLLSEITLRTVRLDDFSFAYLAPDKIQAEMKGEATSYTSVALQSDVFNSRKELHNTIINDMSLEPSGRISFKILTTVDPSLISYGNTLAGRTIVPEVSEVSESPEQSATTTVETNAGTSTKSQ